jgi:hypothetical protein
MLWSWFLGTATVSATTDNNENVYTKQQEQGHQHMQQQDILLPTQREISVGLWIGRDIFLSLLCVVMIGHYVWRTLWSLQVTARVRGRFDPKFRGRKGRATPTSIEWPAGIILFLLFVVSTLIGQPSTRKPTRALRLHGLGHSFRLRGVRFRTNRRDLLSSSQDGKGTIPKHVHNSYTPMTPTDHMAARDHALFGTPLHYHYDVPQVLSTTQGRKPSPSVFDTDSFSIKIDNCCSKTMSGVLTDFVPGSLRSISPKPVMGYDGAHSYITKMGTIRWVVVDDDGIDREILIPDSLFNPTNTTRLLSPQHLAQQLAPLESTKNGTICHTTAESVQLNIST